MDAGRAWTEGLRSGDVAAFEAVYAAFQPRLYGFLIRMTGRRDVAEELLQETFLRLARHAPRLRPDTELTAWLFTVARNLARSWRRWSWLDGARRSALESADRSNPQHDPLAHAAASQAARRLEAALATLKPMYREAFLLVAVDGMTPAQAATVLGLRPDALRQRLARARATLAEALEEGG